MTPNAPPAVSQGQQPDRRSECAAAFDSAPLSGVAEHLQGLLVQGPDLAQFLAELSGYSAGLASKTTGEDIEAVLALERRRRPLSCWGGTARALALGDIQLGAPNGSCPPAPADAHTVIVADTVEDPRWPGYCGELLAHDVRSFLVVPLELDDPAAASLAFFSRVPRAFSDRDIAWAQEYAAIAAPVLRLGCGST